MRALFICGSLNQTRMMHKVAIHLPEMHCVFTPYFCDGLLKLAQRIGVADFTVLGGRFRRQTLAYLWSHNLPVDIDGVDGGYDLVITCSDLVVPASISDSKLLLVQEGMTDPETILYHLVKSLGLPRWLAHTSTTGLSDCYDVFCVASEGYKELFVRKGVKPEKLRVTGIPNFDNCKSFLDNDFPHKDSLLVATSDRRETYKYENRRKFIYRAQQIAHGRPIIFKFHPNEDTARAEREVRRYAPQALALAEGNTDHMIANCHALLTRYSSVVYVALALQKPVYCDLPLDHLRRLQPIQNDGRSAENIAVECRRLLQTRAVTADMVVSPECA